MTIVGARRCSAYGREIAIDLGRELAAAGLTVISGMAQGIDGAVHAGALRGGRTVAVLGCAAERPYPARHRALYGQICRSGLVMSELPPGTSPWRWAFPARNRLMAAMAEMTVVVEAALGSGSLITAELAQEAGRTVGAVPGQVTSPVAAGTNELLHSGAHVIRGAVDVLDCVLGPGAAALPAGGPALEDGLDAMLAACDEHGPSADAVATALRIGAAEAAAGLARLELLGYLRASAVGTYVRTPLADPIPRHRVSSSGDSVMLITILLVVLVVAAGLFFNRRVWRPRRAAAEIHPAGLNVAEMTAPLATLAVLLLVFVLVQTYGSWAAAGRAETDEATATLLLFREIDLVGDPQHRHELQQQVVCYATSVIHEDWPAMGEREISNVPTYWGARLRESGVRLVRTANESTAGTQILERDGERASARQNRLFEARPTVPDALSWLMLVAVLAVLAVLSAAPGTAGFTIQAGIVFVAAAAFASTLLLIRDLDQPYAGALRRDPTQTEFVRNQIAAEVKGPLPCDSSGLPTDAPGFRQATDPLG